MQTQWIWQHPDWPQLHWDDEVIQPQLRQVRLKLGKLLGKTDHQPVTQLTRTELDNLLSNIIASSAIENEHLNVSSVRSSLAKRLGFALESSYPTSDRSEGLASMMFDSINQRDDDLTVERLFQWHRWLFPASDVSFTRLHAGQLRGEETMQVVSGRLGKERVHYEAPPKSRLIDELNDFVNWFNRSRTQYALDPLLRAALAHFWFVTLHPFEDGNGRMTRALTDMALSQADNQSIRLYAMSVAILEHRYDYYAVLENTQRGEMDITTWLNWFMATLEHAVNGVLSALDRTLHKTRFWSAFSVSGLSEPQCKVLNRLLDGGKNGFTDGISAAQYQKVAKVSKATATRHLADLVTLGCLQKLPGGGRSTRYALHTEFEPSKGTA